MLPTTREVLTTSYARLGAMGRVSFCALLELSFRRVPLAKLHLTEATCPALHSLAVEDISCFVDVFRLALPELRRLQAEDLRLSPECAGDFGLSISACPKLEEVSSYKLRGLGADNYVLAPRLRSLVLHRAEGLTHLHLLHAPVLASLNVQAAYDLQELRVDHRPELNYAQVEALVRSLRAARAEASAVSTWKERAWRLGFKGTAEARRLRWVEPHETLRELEPYIFEELLGEHLRHLEMMAFSGLRQRALGTASFLAPTAHPDHLPRCRVNASLATSLSRATVKQLKASPRVQLIRSAEDREVDDAELGEDVEALLAAAGNGPILPHLLGGYDSCDGGVPYAVPTS